ncbi:MAG: transcriptional repressor [Lachnospiraceae bacterium]|nr:transcriptional repressor [Lachnospiraceae bacterium]
MAAKAQYHTHQKEELAAYLRSVPGRHVTAADICAHFQSIGNPIGTATVYRQLERMVREGKVNKYIIDAGSPACFAYAGENVHCEEGVCFHCKCERCGRLIHMRCEELEGIGQHLKDHHHFVLNPMRTVFYGVCEECLLKEDEESEV